ncbi:hypothetical protein EBZ80_19690 [bacterium]|nr:hypothetical protein [bacterium]
MRFAFENKTSSPRTLAHLRSPFAMCLFAAGLISTSLAQTTYEWQTSAPDGNWKRGANNGPRWQPGNLWDEPPQSNILRFNNNTQTSMTQNVGYTFGMHQLQFGSGATTGRTIGGANGISFNDWGGADPKIQNDSGGTHTINLSITGDSNDPLEINPVSGDLVIGGTINNANSDILVYGNNSKMLTLSGVVSGSGKLIIHQNSLVKISAASTYSGNSEINAGELWFTTGGSANSSTIWVGNGGALSTTAKVWIESGGTTISSPINVNNGNPNTRVVGGLNTSGTATFSGAIGVNNGDLNFEAASGGTVEFTGAVTTSSGKYITKAGAGLVILSGSGNNTSIGANVNAGTLRLAKSSSGSVRALNATPIVNSGGTLQFGGSGGDQIPDNVSITVNSGGSVDMNGVSETVNGVSLNGQGVSSGGALVNNSGTSTLTGAITLGAESWIGGSGTLNIASGISGAFNIVKVGTGTTRLQAGTSYSGVTYINNGTLRISSGTSSTSYEIGNTGGSDAAALNLDGGVTLSRSLTVRSGSSGAMFLANTAGTSGTATYSGNLTLNKALTLYANTHASGAGVTLSGSTINLNGNTLTVDGDGGSVAISGPVSGTSGQIVKNGSATTLTLSGNNTYTGNTTINAGTIALSGSGAIGSTPQIIVASGAGLDVSAPTTALSLGSSQSLRATATGANTTATITVAASKNLTLSSGGLVFTARGSGATAPLTVAGSGGSLALNGAPVTVTTTTALAAGTYTLIAKSGSATVSGTPGTLTVNGSGVASGQSAVLSVTNGELVMIVATAPAAPTLGTITPGNGQLSVAFTAGSDGGSAITNYKWSTDGTTYTAFSPATTSSPLVITGLSNGTAYTVSIRAVNAIDDGSVATAGASATPRTSPGAPSITSITAGSGQLSVNFTAPLSDGGDAISNYEFSTNDGSTWTARSPSSTVSPLVITGLTNGTTYTVRIRAVNNAGSGTQSSSSTGTPVAAPTLTAVTLASALTGTYGAAGTAVSFTAAGTDLTANLTVTAQTGFEVSSTQNGTYGSSVAGLTNNSTVWVRTAATRAAGAVANTIVATISGGGAASSANVTSSSSASNSVAQVALTITGLSASNKVYDGLTTATVTGTPAYSGTVNSESFTVSGTVTWAFTDAAVGNAKSLTRTGTYSAPSANYTVTQPTLSANITTRDLTITASNDSKTYGQTKSYGANQTNNFTSSGLQNGETIGSVTITASGGTAATDTATTYTLTPSAATGGTFTASNYSITYSTGTLTVNKAVITVTAANQNVVTGTAVSTVTGNGTVTYTGFQNSETSSVITGSVTYTTTYTSSDAAGTSGRTITPVVTGLSATNYSFTAANGTITVVSPNYGLRDDGGVNLPTLTYSVNGSSSTDKGSVFSNKNLGSTVTSLSLTGANIQIWKTSGGDVTGTKLEYKVWKTTDSEPASYTERSVGYTSQVTGGTTTQVWSSFGSAIDLISGLGSNYGTYNLKVRFTVQGTGYAGTVTDGPVTATFTYPQPATITTSGSLAAMTTTYGHRLQFNGRHYGRCGDRPPVLDRRQHLGQYRDLHAERRIRQRRNLVCPSGRNRDCRKLQLHCNHPFERRCIQLQRQYGFLW